MEQRNIVTCKICGKKFIPTGQNVNVSGSDCGQRCPHCGIWTPVPFMIYREIGGKIPGED